MKAIYWYFVMMIRVNLLQKFPMKKVFAFIFSKNDNQMKKITSF